MADNWPVCVIMSELLSWPMSDNLCRRTFWHTICILIGERHRDMETYNEALNEKI